MNAWWTFAIRTPHVPTQKGLISASVCLVTLATEKPARGTKVEQPIRSIETESALSTAQTLSTGRSHLEPHNLHMHIRIENKVEVEVKKKKNRHVLSLYITLFCKLNKVSIEILYSFRSVDLEEQRGNKCSEYTSCKVLTINPIKQVIKRPTINRRRYLLCYPLLFYCLFVLSFSLSQS